LHRLLVVCAGSLFVWFGLVYMRSGTHTRVCTGVVLLLIVAKTCQLG
jgi:hypothetical protein